MLIKALPIVSRLQVQKLKLNKNNVTVGEDAAFYIDILSLYLHTVYDQPSNSETKIKNIYSVIFIIEI
jgi:hypothetical protein